MGVHEDVGCGRGAPWFRLYWAALGGTGVLMRTAPTCAAKEGEGGASDCCWDPGPSLSFAWLLEPGTEAGGLLAAMEAGAEGEPVKGAPERVRGVLTSLSLDALRHSVTAGAEAEVGEGGWA